MDLTGDRRGQSIQIGAIILFGALIILLSTYQAFVVPDQNRGVEFNHNQEVQQQMQDVRNEIVSARGGGDANPVTVQLGTQYPSRAITINPGPPGGSLRTLGTSNQAVNLTLRNARVSGEAGDYWNQTRDFNTGALVYSPNYNEYTSAPDTVYEQTTLYNRFGNGNITLANQSFIDGTDISLIMLNGSLNRGGGGTVSVDLDPASASTETIEIKNKSGAPITLEFVSRRPATYWDFLESSESTVTNVSDASTPAPSDFHTVELELSTTKTYTLQLTKVGVGKKITDDDTAYLTDIEGQGTKVTQGETTELTLAVRDKYNNPPDNATETTINAEVVGSGSLDSTSKTPDSDGRVTFTYTAPEGTTSDQQLKFSYGGLNDGTFGPGEPHDVTMSVDVQSSGSGTGGGAYTVAWTKPSFNQRIVSDERNFSPAADVRNGITAGTPFQTRTTDAGDPVAMADIDYAVGSSANATFDPSEGLTNGTGYNETGLVHLQDGVTRVYAASGGSGDKTRVTTDRLLNESFEDTENALISNGWYYNDSGNGGEAGIKEESSLSGNAVAGTRVAYINGVGSGSGFRAIEQNYTLDTSNYDSLTVSYVVREPTNTDDADTPDSGASYVPGENLYVQYQSSDGSWVTVDNVSSQVDGQQAYYYRRATISGVSNASYGNFKLRFAQGETTSDDEWQINAIDLVGVNESVETDLNQAPKAHFRYSPDSPTTVEMITFDANRSDDPDGSILTYEWDWDGDGTYEGSGEQATHSYSSSGTYTVTLRVTDGIGETATTSQTVTISSGGGGTIVYNNDASAVDSDGSGTRASVEFSITNNAGSTRTITDMQISSADPTRIYESGGSVPWDHEVTIDTTDGGYADEGSAYELGNRIVGDGYENDGTFENNINSDETSTVYISKFYKNNNNNDRDMQGRSVDVTLYLQNGNTVTFTANP